MKIVIASDSFKGSLSSVLVSEAVLVGLKPCFEHGDFVLIPLADGGEGSVQALAANGQSHQKTALVSGPLNEKVNASFTILNDGITVFIEMATSSGLSRIPTQLRSALKTSSYGSGELIRQGLDLGFRRFIIGLGGSATVDCGTGALTALGIYFKNKSGQTIQTGEGLKDITSIDIQSMDARLQESEFILACDVNNTLLGEKGALMYAPQKGATAKDLEILKSGIENFYEKVSLFTHKQFDTIPSLGAAGGMAAGMYAFLNAKPTSGAELIMELVGFEKKIQDADLIITGEGELDYQTSQGKTPFAVIKKAHAKKIPVVALVGTLGKGYHELYEHGLSAAFSIVNGPLSIDTAMKDAKSLLIDAANNLGRLLKLDYLK